MEQNISKFDTKYLSIKDIEPNLSNHSIIILLFFNETDKDDSGFIKKAIKEGVNKWYTEKNPGDPPFQGQAIFDISMAALEATCLLRPERQGKAKLYHITPLGQLMVEYVNHIQRKINIINI